MAWRAAYSVTAFHAQLRSAHPAAKPPATSVYAWGTVGDLEHQEEDSDHNPNDFPSWGNDIVTAADWPHAPQRGLDAGRVAESLRLSRDPRIKYVIFGGRMFSSYPARGYPAWTWRPYPGKDKHTDHGHLSVVGDRRADQTHPWQIGATMTSPKQEHAADVVIYELEPWLADERRDTGQIKQEIKGLVTEVAEADAQDDRIEGKVDQINKLVGQLAQGSKPTAEEHAQGLLHVEVVKAKALLAAYGYTVTAPATAAA